MRNKQEAVAAAEKGATLGENIGAAASPICV